MKFKDGKTFSTYIRSNSHSGYITILCLFVYCEGIILIPILKIIIKVLMEELLFLIHNLTIIRPSLKDQIISPSCVYPQNLKGFKSKLTAGDKCLCSTTGQPIRVDS